MDFVDFQIRAWQVDETRAQVMVQSSPVGDMRRPVIVPCVPKQLRMFSDLICPDAFMGREPGTLQRIVELGRHLSSMLLPRPVYSLLNSSLDRIAPEDGLRLRLCLDESLVDLPWELLYRADTANQESLAGFFALHPRISLVREAPTLSLKLQPSEERQDLVFAAMAESSGLLTPGAEEEYQRLSEALRPVEDFVAVTFITASEDHIEVALAKPVAIFHYSGTTGVIDGRACLGKDRTHSGASSLLYSETLGGLLRRAGTRVAMFSADRSGRWEFVEPLLRAGLPALIGAQAILPPKAYVAFCQKLYSSLAIGLSLDEAVIWARLHLLEILTASGAEDDSWAAFMVYMPTTEAVLFPRPEHRAVRQRQEATQRERQQTINNVDEMTGRVQDRRPSVNRRDLRERMLQAFSRDDLIVLCADVQQDLTDDGIEMSVSLEVVGGDTLERLVLELIRYLDRRAHLDYLVDAVRRERPGII